MNNILVTGGNGFIGKHLVAELVDADFKVTVVDLVPSEFNLADKFYPQDCIDFFNPAIIRSSMSNLDDLLGHAEQYDAVIHLAAISRVGVSLKHPSRVLSNNTATTLAAAEYCRVSKTPLINISSSSAKWADVNKNPYALSKLMGEQMVNTYRETFGLNASNVRLFNVYGPGEVSNGPYTTLIRKCKTSVWGGIPLPLYGNGSIVRDYTHVYDAVKGIMRVVSECEHKINRPVYEIGTCEPVAVYEILDEFAKAGMLVADNPPREADPPYTKADKELWPPGWTPKIHVLEHVNRWIEMGCPFD